MKRFWQRCAVVLGIAIEERPDFTAAQAVDNWHKVAPHLLALWMLCWFAVLLLSWVQSVPGTELPFLGRTNGVMTSFIICVWMLFPIINSRNLETLFGSGFEMGIRAGHLADPIFCGYCACSNSS